MVIVGPTASGKSELAVRIAKKSALSGVKGFGGEIISADSRQVYRGLTIGTGKVPGKRIIGSRTSYNFIYKGVPHYCIDFVSPKRTYTAAEYKKCAQKAISDIASRGKVPMLVGGTGFWIDAVVYDLDLPAVPPNPKLRKKLEKRDIAELLKMLQKLDPERAKTIEQKNQRRLIRAIEIAAALGKIPIVRRQNRYKTSWIGLNPGQKILKQKIARRIKQMTRNGLIRETRGLLKRGIPRKRIREFGFEYNAALGYLDKKIVYREIYPLLIKDTFQYARRQMTWWGKNPQIHWFTDPKAAEKFILLSPHPN